MGPRMNRALLALSAIFLGTLTMVSLGASPAAPALSSMAVPAMSLTGTWTGTAADYWVRAAAADGMVVSMSLMQSGTAVSGTIRSTPLNPNDGSCSSCHRVKTGTVTGTVTGNALTMTMEFPGRAGEPSPICSVTFTGTATIADRAFTTSYTGNDSCEGAFTNGVLPLTRTFTDATLTAGTTAVSALHILELRVRIDALRANAGLAAYAYADTITAGGTLIRAQHITDLRAALTAVYVARALEPPTFTDASLATGAAIRAVHITQLRTAVLAME